MAKITNKDFNNTVFSSTRKSEAKKYQKTANEDYRKRKVGMQAKMYTTSPKFEGRKTYFVYITKK